MVEAKAKGKRFRGIQRQAQPCNIQYLVSPPSSSSSSSSALSPPLHPRGHRGTHQYTSTHRPGSAGRRTKESLACSSRLVSTTFLTIPRLALVNSSVTQLTPSPHNRPFIPTATWPPCGTIHAPLPVRLPCAIVEISPLHVFIETSPLCSFSRKKSETRRSTNPEATRPIDSDPSEPLPVLPSTSDFRTSLILPECVYTFSLCHPPTPIPTLLPPFIRHRLTCYGTA